MRTDLNFTNYCLHSEMYEHILVLQLIRLKSEHGFKGKSTTTHFYPFLIDSFSMLVVSLDLNFKTVVDRSIFKYDHFVKRLGFLINTWQHFSYYRAFVKVTKKSYPRPCRPLNWRSIYIFCCNKTFGLRLR